MMAMIEPIMQMPRIVKLDLSHNNLNVNQYQFRTAPSLIFAITLKKVTENNWNSSSSLAIL